LNENSNKLCIFRRNLEPFSDVEANSGRKSDPAPSAVKGEIDNVLLPLVFLGVAGPIFVVMYVVMAAIEFKLPQNVQQKRKSSSLSEAMLQNLISAAERMKPMLVPVSSALGRVWEHEECKEKLSCQLAIISKEFRVSRLIGKLLEYDMFMTGLVIFSPKVYQQPMKVFIDTFTANSDFEECANYECF